MTWTSRLRLFLGTLLVLAVAAVATYQLNQKKGVAASDSAQILAETYDVGTPYAGLVVDQMVEVGDTVTAGEPLFVLDSARLQYDLTNGFAEPRTVATKVDDQGRLVLLATGEGTVTDIASERGTFVQSSAQLATVQRAGTLYVQAQYTLTPSEFARLPQDADATVQLPDQRTVQAHVSQVDVETVGGEARAVVTLSGEDLERGADHGLVSAGTPVTAELQLRNDSVVTRTADSVTDYLGGLFG